MNRTSVARGVAVFFACSLTAVVSVVLLGHRSPPPAPAVCGQPVEEVTPLGARLACASEGHLRACSGLRAGDRVNTPCAIDPGAMSGAMRLAAGLPLDINRSTAQELALLSGVGDRTAAAIVAYREAHGNFAKVEDLTAVKGMGSKMLARLRPYLSVER